MRAPLPDPRGLLRGLHEHQVEYVVTGAVAMTFYGYVRLTHFVAPGRHCSAAARLPEWSQLVEEVEVYEIEDMRVPVINRNTLIELKRLRGFHLDLTAIEAIESLEEL